MTASTRLEDRKAEVDAMSMGELLRIWRFAPLGHFQNDDEYSAYFREALIKKRAEDEVGFTAASKVVGWDKADVEKFDG